MTRITREPGSALIRIGGKGGNDRSVMQWMEATTTLQNGWIRGTYATDRGSMAVMTLEMTVNELD